MSIATSAQQKPITSPTASLQISDKEGKMTGNARVALQQLHSFVVNMARNVPTNAATTGTTISLTPLDVAPLLTQYTEGDQYHFVADTSPTGTFTAQVLTPTGTLANISIFTANGATAATTGTIVSGSQYWLTYVSSLNAGAGGFVLR